MRCVREIQAHRLSLITVGLFLLPLLCAVFEATAQETQAVEFAVASIRWIPSGTPIPAEALGIACHGADGVRQAVTAVKIGVDPVLVPPRGRCRAYGVTLQSVIGFAYDVSERNVSGGPGWVRMSGRIGLDPGTFTFRETETFLIEAVADNLATAKVGELRRMLQTMLVDRFGLKSHRETRRVQGYSLVIAKGGPKIQEVSGPYESPRAIFDETLRRSIKGTSRLNELIDILLPSAFGPFSDKTGLAGVYKYEFPAPLPAPPPPPAPPGPIRDGPAGRGTSQGIAVLQSMSSAISDLSRLLESQLGLRLQADLVPHEILVIDSVERPSAN